MFFSRSHSALLTCFIGALSCRASSPVGSADAARPAVERMGFEPDPVDHRRMGTGQINQGCAFTIGSFRHCAPSPQVSPAYVAATAISASP